MPVCAPRRPSGVQLPQLFKLSVPPAPARPARVSSAQRRSVVLYSGEFLCFMAVSFCVWSRGSLHHPYPAHCHPQTKERLVPAADNPREHATVGPLADFIDEGKEHSPGMFSRLCWFRVRWQSRSVRCGLPPARYIYAFPISRWQRFLNACTQPRTATNCSLCRVLSA